MTTSPNIPAAGDGAAVAELQARGRNVILRSLPADEYATLWPHLERVELEVLDVLAEVGGPLHHTYFPETAIISVLRPADGALVEAGTIGREGMAGLGVLLGAAWSTAMLTAQVPGICARIPFDTLRQALPGLPALSALLSRFTLAFLDQVGQQVACNARHPVERRCARWMAMTRDRVDGDTFLLTHEVLAQMLGVRRAGVTVAARALQKEGLIRYTRGKVTVLDRAGLEAAACACYGINRDHFARLVGATVAEVGRAE